MEVNLKENIFIEGFDSLQLPVVKYLDSEEIIYSGRTSEVSEELAKECVVEVSPDWGLYFYKDYSRNSNVYVFCETAKQSIQSACDQEYCIIYKKQS